MLLIFTRCVLSLLTSNYCLAEAFSVNSEQNLVSYAMGMLIWANEAGAPMWRSLRQNGVVSHATSNWRTCWVVFVFASSFLFLFWFFLLRCCFTVGSLFSSGLVGSLLSGSLAFFLLLRFAVSQVCIDAQNQQNNSGKNEDRVERLLSTEKCSRSYFPIMYSRIQTEFSLAQGTILKL